MRETRTQKIERMMRVYKCSYDEALQLVLDDEATDRGVLHEWNLTKEQEKALRKTRQADREKPTPTDKPKEKVKRERKQDDDKKYIVSEIATLLEKMDLSKNVQITKIEGEIQLEYNQRKIKIVVSAPRK